MGLILDASSSSFSEIGIALVTLLAASIRDLVFSMLFFICCPLSNRPGKYHGAGYCPLIVNGLVHQVCYSKENVTGLLVGAFSVAGEEVPVL